MKPTEYWQAKADYHRAQADKYNKRIDAINERGDAVPLSMRHALYKHVTAAEQAQKRAIK